MKKILGVLIALMITTKAFASISVMPTRIELNADKSRSNYITTAVEVKGDQSEVVRFKAYTGYFTINERGEMVQVTNSNDSHDISKKVKFVPSEFNVFPGKSQKVRINIVGLNSLPEGESRAVLYIEDVNPKEYAVDTGRQGIGAQLIVKTRIGIPIYIDKKSTKKAEIQNFDLVQDKGAYSVKSKVVSTGNSKIRYKSSAQIINEKKLIKDIELSTGVVGNNNYRNISDKIDLTDVPAGNYTFRYILSYVDEKGKKQNLTQETTIQVYK